MNENDREGCKAYFSGGGYRCDRCNLTWDYEDTEPPKCLTVKEVEKNKRNEIIKNIRNN